MVYLAERGTLAGLCYGRRRLGLGERWDRECHVYLGLGGMFERSVRSRTESGVLPDGERPVAGDIAATVRKKESVSPRREVRDGALVAAGLD